MRPFLVLALAALLAGCGTSDTSPRCELGRSQSCACSSGATGAQECGPLGVWSVCLCAGADAGPDATPATDVETRPDVVADAAADTVLDSTAADAASDAPADVIAPRDAGSDAAADTSNPCPVGQTLCGVLGEPNACVNLQRGYVEGGQTYACGRCNNSCGVGLRCVLGMCQ